MLHIFQFLVFFGFFYNLFLLFFITLAKYISGKRLQFFFILFVMLLSCTFIFLHNYFFILIFYSCNIHYIIYGNIFQKRVQCLIYNKKQIWQVSLPCTLLIFCKQIIVWIKSDFHVLISINNCIITSLP